MAQERTPLRWSNEPSFYNESRINQERIDLSTEAGWEYVVYGDLVDQEFPWGDEDLDHDYVPRNNVNFSGKGSTDKWADKTALVNNFPSNGTSGDDVNSSKKEHVRNTRKH